MNADERRLIASVHRKGRKERKVAQKELFYSSVNKIRYGINNELERTDTNSGHSEFVRVRISSLLISVLRLLCAPAHERAACACCSSAVEPRGGMSMEGGRMMEIEEMLKIREKLITMIRRNNKYQNEVGKYV
ncbi:hypothetical protein ig2599ANME_0260 [groundwater metagenome]